MEKRQEFVFLLSTEESVYFIKEWNPGIPILIIIIFKMTVDQANLLSLMVSAWIWSRRGITKLAITRGVTWRPKDLITLALGAPRFSSTITRSITNSTINFLNSTVNKCIMMNLISNLYVASINHLPSQKLLIRKEKLFINTLRLW